MATSDAAVFYDAPATVLLAGFQAFVAAQKDIDLRIISLSFTNHEEATKPIVRRTYREGFAPPQVV